MLGRNYEQRTYVIIVLYLYIDPFVIIDVLLSDSQQGFMVGSSQDIECTIRVPFNDEVEPNSVMFNWTGPSGISITNDGRVNISPISSSNNTFTSILQFSYLMEGDEGTYTCNVTILSTTVQDNTEIKTLTG